MSACADSGMSIAGIIFISAVSFAFIMAMIIGDLHVKSTCGCLCPKCFNSGVRGKTKKGRIYPGFFICTECSHEWEYNSATWKTIILSIFANKWVVLSILCGAVILSAAVG